MLFILIWKKDKLQKYAHIRNRCNHFLYLILMLLAISYFSPGQLESTIWPTYPFSKLLSFLFIERTEYIAVTFWLLIILPNLMLYLWAAVRGAKRTFGKIQ